MQTTLIQNQTAKLDTRLEIQTMNNNNDSQPRGVKIDKSKYQRYEHGYNEIKRLTGFNPGHIDQYTSQEAKTRAIEIYEHDQQQESIPPRDRPSTSSLSMTIGLDETFHLTPDAGDASIFKLEHYDCACVHNYHDHYDRINVHIYRIITIIRTVETYDEAYNIVRTAQSQMGCYCELCTHTWASWIPEFYAILHWRVFKQT